jgi:hypothetical protein
MSIQTARVSPRCLRHLYQGMPLVSVGVTAWVLGVVVLCTSARSDEGMFPISMLDRLDLADKGMELKPSEIINPNDVALLDGICRVNGCTGSFVSDRGLIITNHHCAYGAIQSASTTENDYLANGFMARTLQEEIIAKGYTVRITENYRDVSEQVLMAVDESLTPLERTQAIERRRKELEKQAEEEHPGMRAEVAEMFAGRTYFLFLYTYLKDVRLVFAPPASVGNFGGEVDNWEWPRHTGDFSFMRAYTAPDGSSADYSPNNVPYRPKQYIPVAREGVDEGDFVFLLGYPGRTARHKTASFLEYEQGVRLPYIVNLYGWQIATMEAAGANDREVAIKLASRMRGLANVEKRSRGQLQGLKRADIVDTRRAAEAALQEYIDADPDRAERYGSVLQEIAEVYAEMTSQAAFELNFDQLKSASRTLAIAFTLVDAAMERVKDDLDRETAYMDRNFDQTRKSLLLDVADLHLPTDQLMLLEMLTRLSAAGAAEQLEPLRELLATPAALEESAQNWLSATRLTNPDFVNAALEMTPSALQGTGEPILDLMFQLHPKYVEMRQLNKSRDGSLDRLYGLLIEVKQQFLERDFIPDANATLRLTYGNIKSYAPADGIIKTPITTLRGVMEKATGEEPFVVPERIQQMFAAEDFGPFVHPRLGQVPVAILYDTDTTGGNSGSPVINARGELVGVNFDRAFEATINDFAWNENYSRSIGVDIRYCLWITGMVYGATHLLEEMGVSGFE